MDNFAKNADMFFIIDVREETEIAETGSIPNSINIPRGLIELKLAPSDDDQGLHATTPIIVYCGGGSRASLAGRTLVDLDLKMFRISKEVLGAKEFSD